MAVASWLVWREPTLRRRPALVIYAMQLALNSLWSWLFFAWHQGLWACVEIVVLWMLIGATVVRFWRIRRAAAALLIPYWLWVSFASGLAFAVWRRNPALL
jgi:tryptophan-rich sensory protein